VDELGDLKFDTQLDCSNSQPMDEGSSWKGRGYVTWPI